MNAILKFRVLFILFLSVLAGCGIIDMEWNVSEYLYGKPRYQELTIGYHYLGWDPKRERFFFIKTLTEYRDFKSGVWLCEYERCMKSRQQSPTSKDDKETLSTYAPNTLSSALYRRAYSGRCGYCSLTTRIIDRQVVD